jgi:YD repeat-containing protein
MSKPRWPGMPVSGRVKIWKRPVVTRMMRYVPDTGTTWTAEEIWNSTPPIDDQQVVVEPSAIGTTWTWDYENQPTLVQLPTGVRVTMAYHADNRRVKQET